MTIDERLEALAIRHEALTQSVEMLLQSQKMQGVRLTELDEKTNKRFQELAEQSAKTEEQIRRVGRYSMVLARDLDNRLFALENFGQEPGQAGKPEKH